MVFDLPSEIDLFLRKNGRTELVLNVNEALACQCKIHQPVVHSVVDGVGCERWAHGTMQSIKALYRDGPVRFCHAEPGQRALDVGLARLASNLDITLASYAGAPYKPVAKYIKGSNVSVGFLGAGYCYLSAFVPEVRVRAARVLGPKALVLDVMRLMRVVGLANVGDYSLDMVAPGLCHLSLTGGNRKGTASGLIKRLKSLVVAHGSDLRIGADEDVSDLIEVSQPGLQGSEYSRVVQFIEDNGIDLSVLKRVLHDRSSSFADRGKETIDILWHDEGAIHVTWDYGLLDPEGCLDAAAMEAQFRSLGLVFPFSSMVDLAVVCLPPSSHEVFVSGLREKFKRWALLGDAYIRMYVTKRCVIQSMLVGDISKALESKVSNKALRAKFIQLGFHNVHRVSAADASPRCYGDAFEALIYLIVVYLGESVLYKFLEGIDF